LLKLCLATMKIAVLGGTGLLGRAIAREWCGDELTLAGSRDIDVRDIGLVERYIAQNRPDWVILAAALADVDACEQNPELADAINHRGASNVAKACNEHGVRLMFISTDYVFGADSKTTPWEVEDPVSPANVYAQSKAAAEDSVRRILSEACIARVSWLFGAPGRCFPVTALKLAESGASVPAFTDQHGIPNFTREVARALMLLARAGASGTVHVTNSGVTTWYDFSRELLPLAGHDAALVRAIKMAQVKRPAQRPHYSALSDRSLRAYGIQVPHWRESLRLFLTDRVAAAEKP